MSAKEVLIVGPFDGVNKGEDLILESILHRIQKKPVLLSSNKHYEDRYPVKTTESIKEGVRKTQGVIVTGAFFDHAPHLKDFLTASFEAQKQHKPLAWIALGVGNVPQQRIRRNIEQAAQHARYISVRDLSSKANLVAMGIPAGKIEVTRDPVYGLDIPKKGENKYVVVVVKEINTEIEKMIRAIVKKHEVYVLATADEKIELRGVRTISLGPNQTTKELLDILKHAYAIVSFRLHPLILGAKWHIPIVGIDTNAPRITHAMHEHGLANYAVPVDKAATALEDLLAKKYLIHKIKHHTAVLKGWEKTNIFLLRKL